jgi:hypothetical protein
MAWHIPERTHHLRRKPPALRPVGRLDSVFGDFPKEFLVRLIDLTSP